MAIVLTFMAIVVALLYVRTAFRSLTGTTHHVPRATHPVPRAAAQQSRHSTPASGSFAFLDTTPRGRPVTYDPCHPIHYVINPGGLPKGGLGWLRHSIRAISAATGLRFIEDGLTQERPVMTYREELLQRQRYGYRWPPVLIAWADQAEHPPLGGNLGVARSVVVTPHGPESARYVTGQIVLNREAFTTMLTRADSADARATVMHELGHLVGLAHVNDPDELMNPKNTRQQKLGPGDRRGLAEVGKGPCWPGT